MVERWLPVVGYEDHYLVSSRGNVKTIVGKLEGRILKLQTNKKGYKLACLTNNNREEKTWQVHRLVLFAFKGLPPKGKICRHLDGNPANNKLKNLKWGTHKENQHDRFDHGTMQLGEDSHYSKLTEKEVIRIKKDINLGNILKLALKYNVHPDSITNIHRERTWSHVKVEGFVPHKINLQSGRKPKINEDQVKEIVKLFNKGKTYEFLRIKFGISFYTIKKIMAGEYNIEKYRAK